MGMRTLGSVVAKTSSMPDECVGTVQGIRDEAVGSSKDILMLFHDGPTRIVTYQINAQDVWERRARFDVRGWACEVGRARFVRRGGLQLARLSIGLATSSVVKRHARIDD